MKKVLSILLILTTLLAFSSCKNDSKVNLSENVQNVTTEEAYELIASKKNLVILDVRTENEYKDSHIKDSISMPSEKLDLNIDQIIKFKDNPVLVYCRTGRRSSEAINILSKYGFKNIYHMYQGIVSWKYDLVK